MPWPPSDPAGELLMKISLGLVTAAAAFMVVSFGATLGSTAFHAITSSRGVSGYAAGPSSGSDRVSGPPVSKAIMFTSSGATSYTVTFSEGGLTAGTAWSVTFRGSALGTAAPDTLDFYQPNGTYAFTVGPSTGYTPTPASGNVTVDGSAQVVTITFTTPSGSSPSSGSSLFGLSPATFYALAGTVIAILIAATVMVLRMRGGRRPKP